MFLNNRKKITSILSCIFNVLSDRKPGLLLSPTAPKELESPTNVVWRNLRVFLLNVERSQHFHPSIERRKISTLPPFY